MINELERICKDAVVAKFKILPRHFSAVTEKTMKTLSQDTQSRSRDVNWNLSNTKQSATQSTATFQKRISKTLLDIPLTTK